MKKIILVLVCLSLFFSCSHRYLVNEDYSVNINELEEEEMSDDFDDSLGQYEEYERIEMAYLTNRYYIGKDTLVASFSYSDGPETIWLDELVFLAFSSNHDFVVIKFDSRKDIFMLEKNIFEFEEGESMDLRYEDVDYVFTKKNIGTEIEPMLVFEIYNKETKLTSYMEQQLIVDMHNIINEMLK